MPRASNFIHQNLESSAHMILLADMTIRLYALYMMYVLHCMPPAPWWLPICVIILCLCNVWFSHVAILWHILKYDSAQTCTHMHLIRLDWYIIYDNNVIVHQSGIIFTQDGNNIIPSHIQNYSCPSIRPLREVSRNDLTSRHKRLHIWPSSVRS